jgi:hypothetical protein
MYIYQFTYFKINLFLKISVPFKIGVAAAIAASYLLQAATASPSVVTPSLPPSSRPRPSSLVILSYPILSL